MPPLSGKDAILAAARRLAELGDDALDEDLLDAELALAGPAHDEDEAFAGGPVDGEPPLRPEDLGLPPRLAAWLARHGGRDVRRAFGVAARAAQRLVPDADGHVALGRAAGASVSASSAGAAFARPRYKPLEERIVPLSEAAAPTPRAFEYVPPAELERRKARSRLEARSAEAWKRGGEASKVDPRRVDNAAVSVPIKNLIAAGSKREREADLPKGAGPAGRHEPTTRADEKTSVPSVMGVSLFSSSRGNLPGLKRASSKTSDEDEDALRRLAGAERRAATNALLCRLPEIERPVIGTTSGQSYGGVVKKRNEHDDPLKVPRTLRQSTLDALVAAALLTEAELRGVAPKDAFAVMDKNWLELRPKTRRRAIKAGVEAETRVFQAASSAAAYRGLAANALSALKKTAGDVDIPEGRKETKNSAAFSDVLREDETTDVLNDLPDALSVVPKAARNRGSNVGLAISDEAAVAAAVTFEREGMELTRKRNRGVGFILSANKGALLQNYTNADGIDLKTATTPKGDAVSFFAETVKHFNPRVVKRTSVPRTRRVSPSLVDAFDTNDAIRKTVSAPNGEGGTTFFSPAKDEGDTNATNTKKSALISNAARALIRSFLEPFLDVGTITEAFAKSIEHKAVSKVLLKRGDEKDASFLQRDKEYNAVKALTREYVRQGEKKKREARDDAHTEHSSAKEKKRARRETPAFDFDVDDL